MHDKENAEPSHFNWKELNLRKVSQGQPDLFGDGEGIRIEQNGSGSRVQKPQNWDLPNSQEGLRLVKPLVVPK